jgi:hypothetical protein
MVEQAGEPKKEKRKGSGGLFIPAGLFIGMGVGWALGYLVQGMFIGLGAGFLAFGIVMVAMRD